jgi:hypothetical protein
MFTECCGRATIVSWRQPSVRPCRPALREGPSSRRYRPEAPQRLHINRQNNPMQSRMMVVALRPDPIPLSRPSRWPALSIGHHLAISVFCQAAERFRATKENFARRVTMSQSGRRRLDVKGRAECPPGLMPKLRFSARLSWRCWPRYPCDRLLPRAARSANRRMRSCCCHHY